MAEQAIPEQELFNRVYKGPNKTGDNIDGLVSLVYFWDSNSSTWQRASTTQAVSLPSTTPVPLPALSTTVTQVKGSAGEISNYIVWNPNATVAYVQIFDKATTGAVTLGTTVANAFIPVPPGATANLARVGWSFSNGIQVAATTTATGSTALTTAVDANFGYR